jgi:hypothetical protein
VLLSLYLPNRIQCHKSLNIMKITIIVRMYLYCIRLSMLCLNISFNPLLPFTPLTKNLQWAGREALKPHTHLYAGRTIINQCQGMCGIERSRWHRCPEESDMVGGSTLLTWSNVTVNYFIILHCIVMHYMILHYIKQFKPIPPKTP